MRLTVSFISLPMLAKVNSVAHKGLLSTLVEVEVDVAERGFPGFSIVGLPSKAIEEAKERVKTAINNSRLSFPEKKITVNLAPADLVKDGSCYDLPIAIGILLASGSLPTSLNLNQTLFYGELSLDGRVRHTSGVLLVAIFAQKEKLRAVFVSRDSSREAAVVPGIQVFAVRNLEEIYQHLSGGKSLVAIPQIIIDKVVNQEARSDFDLSEVIGQEQAKRALTIAASGGHNLLMSGPPGSGKTMLARALPSILPPLSSAEALEVTRIYSATGLLGPGEGLVRVRPFRFPHHSTSLVGLIGGGSRPKPGEISLAHHGVLFLDEMAEFPRSVLEAMRQPMEDGVVAVSRAAGRVEFPAGFMLIAAVNPCPCGYLGHPKKACQCSLHQIEKYKRRLSGPILDRIDLHVCVPFVEAEKLGKSSPQTESSANVRAQVISARVQQSVRLAKSRLFTNAQMRNREVKEFCALNKEGARLLKLAVNEYSLSTRSYFRILKVARTIADLSGEANIEAVHLAEALQYRLRVF